MATIRRIRWCALSTAQVADLQKEMERRPC